MQRDIRVSEELMAVTKLGKILNCAINVVVYFKYNPKFRKHLKEAFRGKKYARKFSITSTTYHETSQSLRTDTGDKETTETT